MSETIETPLRSLSRSRFATASWLVGALYCAVFAIMAVLFPVAIASGTHDLWATIQAAFTSAAYSYGPHSAVAQHPIYRNALGGMSLHTIAGGAALLAATTQFVPMVRRRWPAVHRTAGALVVILVAASMIGSLVVQASHPLATTLSGAGFGIGLASLCGLTLTELALAVLAIRARDYRSHMGWMALMFASLLTAPALRVQWLVFGATGLTLDAVNILVAVPLIPETILFMAFWMASVGARDLGLAKARSILPLPALRVLAVLSAIVVIHEGCLVPFGFGLGHDWRGDAHALPKAAIVWAFATAVLALRAPTDLRRLAEGGVVRRPTLVLALLAALGSVIVAATLEGHDLQTSALRSFFCAWGVEIALLVVLAQRSALGQAAPWAMQGLYLALVPALSPFLFVSYGPFGVRGAVAVTTAVSIAYAAVAALGFASGFGLRIVVSTRRRARVVATVPAA